MTKDEFMAVETGDLAGLERAWEAYEREQLMRERDEALDLLRGMCILVQLICLRNDVSDRARLGIMSNYRFLDAQDFLAKHAKAAAEQKEEG